MKVAHSTTLLAIMSCLSLSMQTRADNLDTIGLTDLLAREPELDGSGLTVAQVEAPTSTTEDPITGETIETYQPNPAAAGQASSKFSYYDSSSLPLPTPDPLSNPGVYDATKQSSHANSVANGFYDATTGVATDVSEVRVFSANTFVNSFLVANININSSVINQSFVFGEASDLIDQIYDNYAAEHFTLFVNGLNNGSSTAIPSPATMYNSISVGREDLNHSVGPTDGRSKPDIIATGTATSFATPYVSGSAAVLMEAANLGHGGDGTENDAADIRTIKALLLNGAVKDTSWSNSDIQPLDSRRGAGLLNINNSHLQLEGGQHAAIESANIAIALNYPPSDTAPSANITSPIGWNFSTITNSTQGPNANTDRIDNYYFDIPANTSQLYDLTASLVWLRQNNQSDINNLDLILYDTATEEVIEQSISTVDNVEHIYTVDLPAGRYLLQVIKRSTDMISNSEDYALAFNFSVPAPDAPTSLSAIALENANVALSWTDNSNDELAFELQRSTLSTRGFVTVATLAPNTTSHTDTAPLTDTSYSYRVKATNSNGDSFFSNVATITTISSFDPLTGFRFSNFGITTNTGNAANDADPDSDGLSNLTEYALGTDPTSAAGADGGAAHPQASIVTEGGNDYLQLTVNRTEISAGVSYFIDISGEPGSGWTEATDILENTATTLRVRDSEVVSDHFRRFIRLRVEEN